MIRRTDHNHWLLIDQIEHARIAAELAAEWADPEWQAFRNQWPILDAILHHDDGWLDWDAEPQLDPQTGQPRDFTEMRLADSTALWRLSIEECDRIDPVAGHWVSLHFGWLAEQALENRTDVQDLAAARQFLQTQRASSRADAEVLHTGLRWLQMFDRLSLWLCCSPPPQSRQLETPSGRPLQMTFASPLQPEMTLWPYESDRIQLQTAARRVPRKHYDRQSFQVALRAANEPDIRWSLSSFSAG